MDSDRTEQLAHAVGEARQARRRLRVSGHGTKRAWHAHVDGEMLSLDEHAGIVDYQPAELVVTVRAGTPLKVLAQTLAQERQMLAADPPQFAGGGTVGGAVASGLSGPARPWAGALRDAVLGARVLTGRGEVLRFGGQVMKNVAGYDVARLYTGSWGSLGALLDVSLRVQPLPERLLTLCFDRNLDAALDQMRAVARMPVPVTGSFWTGGRLWLRFSGAESTLRSVQRRIGGEEERDSNLWPAVRDHAHAFFKPVARTGGSPPASLVRIVCPPAAALGAGFEGDHPAALEWGGAQRWIWHPDVQSVCEYAARVGGWAWRLGYRYDLDAGHARLMSRIRAAFDPDHVFSSPMSDCDADAH